MINISHQRTVRQYYQQAHAAATVAYATPHALITLLFDGALEHIAIAKGAMLHQSFAEKGARIGQAISIIGGLRESLHAKHGSDLVRDLDALYDYMQRQLTKANIDNRPEIVDEVMRLLKEIKTAWDAIPSDLRDGHAAIKAMPLR
jgi:flagellar protein FliS